MFRISTSQKLAVQSIQASQKRFASYQLDGPLPKRPLKKIRLGKARPAIYYKFNCKTEFSDGSVVNRRHVIPRDELRFIQDQRNTPLWNPNRTDLEVVDANAGGKLEKFRQKFSQFQVEEEVQEDKKDGEESLLLDDYLDLLGQNVQQVQKGGKLATKQKSKKK